MDNCYKSVLISSALQDHVTVKSQEICTFVRIKYKKYRL